MQIYKERSAIRLIASDIDGTLIQNGEHALQERLFTQIRHLTERGIIFCAASGRQFSSLQKLFQPVADQIYYLCENGAIVYGPEEPHTPIAKTIIERERALQLCADILAIEECELLISGANTSYLCPKDSSYIDHIRYFVGNNVEIIPSPEAMPEDFLKISAYYKKGATQIEALLAPKWKQSFSVAIAGFAWLDFTVADKGTGMNSLLKHLQISPAETMAFGDNFNDVPMLDSVGYPYIMSSAHQSLQERYPLKCNRVEDVLEQIESDLAGIQSLRLWK